MRRNPWIIAIVIGIIIGSASFFFWGVVTEDLQTVIKLTASVLVAATLLVRLFLS